MTIYFCTILYSYTRRPPCFSLIFRIPKTRLIYTSIYSSMKWKMVNSWFEDNLLKKEHEKGVMLPALWCFMWTQSSFRIYFSNSISLETAKFVHTHTFTLILKCSHTFLLPHSLDIELCRLYFPGRRRQETVGQRWQATAGTYKTKILTWWKIIMLFGLQLVHN